MVKSGMNTKSKKPTYKKSIAILISLAVSKAYGQGYYFAVGDLSSLGVSAVDAKKLLESDTFQPGNHRLAITVNGQDVKYDGKVNIRNDGQPCMSESLLSDVGISTKNLNFDSNSCLASRPGSDLIVKPNPKSRRIDILVPFEFIEKNKSNYLEGGNAALLNYNLQGFNLRSKYSHTNSYAGFITAGFNTDNWIFRNKSTLSNSNGKNELKNTQTYLQKTFDSQDKILRIGDVDYYDQFYGVSLRGLQWTPEPSLVGGPITSLQGLSNEDSQIEVYQLGQLVYAGQVQAGYYKIDSVPVLNSQSPYEVVLTSPNGKKSKSLVSAAEAIINQSEQQNGGFSFAAGKATNINNKHYDKPLVASASYTWGITNNLRLGGGALVSENYYSIAGSTAYNLTPRNTISVTEYFSETKDPKSKSTKLGNSSTLLLTNALGNRLTLSNSLRYRTNDYRGIEDVGSEYLSYYKWQQSNSLSANLSDFGSLGLTYSINEGDGRRQNNYSATWGKGILSAYLTATIQKQLTEHKNKSFEETRFYAQVSIPLSGNQRVSSSYTSSDNWHRLSTEYRKSENSGFNYGLGYSRETNEPRKEDSVFLEASKTTRFANIGGRINFNDNYKSLASYVGGGIVIDKSSITFSPHQIGDTFAVVNVGKYPDIELQTPNGKVWTDGNGNAVVSSLSSFNNNLITVNSKTSPKNLDIMNGIKRITPSRGTFKNLKFETKEVNRVIVYAKDRSNKSLPYGALVTDELNGAIVGFVDKDGMIFFNDMPRGKVKVGLGNDNSCSIVMGNEDALSKVDMFTTLHKTCE